MRAQPSSGRVEKMQRLWFCAHSTRDEEIPIGPQNLLIPTLSVFFVRQCKLGGVLFTVEMSLLKGRRGRRCEEVQIQSLSSEKYSMASSESRSWLEQFSLTRCNSTSEEQLLI